MLHSIISENLKKYNTSPVHSVVELIALKEKYIPNFIDFFGISLHNEMIAGAIVFYFIKQSVMHTQYLCAKAEFSKLSPMSFAYYSMILEAKKRDFNKLSFGVSTEDFGKKLNIGLLQNKENYGTSYSINKTFYKEL